MKFHASKPADVSSLTKPMALWLAVQLLALAIGAGGVALSAHRVNPPERLAIEVMLTIQVAAAALFFPMLLISWRAFFAVGLSALPFLQAAAFLSATPVRAVIHAGEILIVWLLTLTVLSLAGKRIALNFIIRAAVVVWCIGGALMAYWCAEFSTPIAPSAAGPIVQILSALQGENVVASLLSDASVLVIALTIQLSLGKNRAMKNEAS